MHVLQQRKERENTVCLHDCGLRPYTCRDAAQSGTHSPAFCSACTRTRLSRRCWAAVQRYRTFLFGISPLEQSTAEQPNTTKSDEQTRRRRTRKRKTKLCAAMHRKDEFENELVKNLTVNTPCLQKKKTKTATVSFPFRTRRGVEQQQTYRTCKRMCCKPRQ